MDNYLLISSDGHAGPPAHIYRDYLDPQYRGRFDEQQAEAESMRALSPMASGEKSDFQTEWELATDGDGGLTAAYDGAERNRVLDREGVAAEVLFPDADVLGTGRIASSPFGTGLAAGSQSEPELAVAGCRAHNRWLGDFCGDDPLRRIGIAVIPAIIPEMDTVLELVREAKELGHRGILIPSRWFDRPPYNEPWYDPLWALTEELGLVLHTHSGAGPSDYTGGYGLGPIYASEAGWWAARPLHVLIWAGVFERFPNLMYSQAENAAWWVPDVIRKMDEKWHGYHNTKKMGSLFTDALPNPPRFYLDRNCFFGASTPAPDDIERRHDVGVDNIMWGNDMPHPEGTFPYTHYFVRERFKDVPEDEARRMLGLTAAKLYALDVEALRPFADRIGPTFEEVHGGDVVLDAPAEAIA
ncbi:MAG: amidohydrolase [Acidimicrobiia bacterium]|nr:amidohydrolase [Acidimicrobiia bacterium]